jgi:excisionase family DNA binding protein
MKVATTNRADQPKLELLAVHRVAEILSCSTRHVYRLSSSGRMPPAVKVGALARWSREAIEAWVAANCPSCRV